jgi:hypothetical protein
VAQRVRGVEEEAQHDQDQDERVHEGRHPQRVAVQEPWRGKRPETSNT